MDDDIGRESGGVGLGEGRGFPSRGRSSGLGGFERQTSERGGWFDSRSGGGLPGEEMPGSTSPRKGYTRAPFDDWRRGDSAPSEGGVGAPGGPGTGDAGDGWRTTTSARRQQTWAGAGAGWRSGQGGDRENNFARSKYSDGPGGVGRASNDRWRKEGEDKLGRGGGLGAPGGLNRQRSRDDHLPEWAIDDPQGEGGFDNEGKFRDNHLKNKPDWGNDGPTRWEDEEVDPDDVPDSKNNSVKSISEERESSEKPTVPLPNGELKSDSVESAKLPEEKPPLKPIEEVEPEKGRTLSSGPGDHLERMAGNIVASLVDEDDVHDSVPPQADAGPPLTRPPPEATPGSNCSTEGISPSAAPQTSPPSDPPITWSYLDPQRQVQGPFESEEMFEWYSARYFPADLMVRRNTDGRFISLTEMSQLYGRVPFTPGPTPPPILSAEEERAKQQQLMVQQMLAQQQQQIQAQLQAQQQQQLLALQQQQQQQQQQAAQQAHQHHYQGSLGNLGSFGGLVGPERGYPSPDPIRSLLGGLGGPSLGGIPGLGVGHPGLGQSLTDPQDPLKALLARTQTTPTMPGLGHRPFPNHSPPLTHPSVPQRTSPEQSLFGLPSKPDLQLGQPPHAQSLSHPTPPTQTIPPPKQSPEARANFDPIQSLLQQLQNSAVSTPSSPQLGLKNEPTSQNVSSGHVTPDQFKQNVNPQPPAPVQSIWDMPKAQEVEHQPDSIWNTEPRNEVDEPEEISENSPEPTDDNQVEPETVNGQDPVVDANFVKPKSNEKKDKKSKKAEEKRKAKEAKKAADQSSSAPYIPGMSSSKPEEQIVATGNILDQKEEEERRALLEAAAQQKAQMEALAKLQEEQKLKLEREELIRQQQEKLAKLAPWAKKESPMKEPSNGGLSLQEIQRLEAERERQERIVREKQEARAREDQRRLEEEERQRRAAKTVNWASVSSSGLEKVKSLAEIQAEEARVEKDRADKEIAASRSVRQNNNPGGSWGGPTKSMSWAGKIAASAPAPHLGGNKSSGNPWANTNGSSNHSGGSPAVVAPAGFWDPVVPEDNHAKNNSNAQSNNQQNKNKKNKGKNKKAEEEAKVKQIFAENKPKNEFEDWCVKTLNGLQAQVDIPTFLGFLMDIESPFEVHDYVKSYVGEGKAQKKFAVDYLERRSRWKNSLKGGTKYEDDLNTPANALNPGDSEFQFQEAGKKGKKTKSSGKPIKSGKQDMSHLLGFSVSGQGVNRGELDVPQ